jgi:hypothetical protein
MVTILSKGETYAMLASHHLEWDLPNELVHVNIDGGEAHGLIYHNGTRKAIPTDVVIYLDKRYGVTGNMDREIAEYTRIKYGWANVYFYRTSITNPTLRFIIQNHNKKVLG